MAIKLLDTTRLIAARTRSKAGRSSSFTLGSGSGFSKRWSILLLIDFGIMKFTALAQITVIRTKNRDKKLEENFSSPPSF